jgi:hypothetical protein
MTTTNPTPPEAALVAIDVAKMRNEILIEIPGHRRQSRQGGRVCRGSFRLRGQVASDCPILILVGRKNPIWRYRPLNSGDKLSQRRLRGEDS